jgi:hypothetical protein
VTQKYGKGIVQYGAQTSTTFGTDGNGGSYDNNCSAEGKIYLEVDLQVPCSVGANSLDGYSGLTTTIAGDTGSDLFSTGGTLNFIGSDAVDTAVTDDTVTISIKDASSTNKGVASFSSTDFTVTAGAVSLNKDPVITLSGDVTGSATMTNLGSVEITTTIEPNSVSLGIDTTGSYISTITGTPGEIIVSGSGSESAAVTIGLPDDLTVAGDLTVNGNLDVQGSINSISTTEVNIVDNKVVLNTNVTGAPSADAGLKVNRGTSADVELLWNETADQWTLTNDGTNYHEITRKYKETLNASATSYTVTHNLGTKDIVVSIYEVASPYAEIIADVEHTSDTAATIKFAVAPASGEYRVVVIG